MGLGKILQGRFRERREKMQLKLKGSHVYFLNAVLRDTRLLPLGEAGLAQQNGTPMPFKSKDIKDAKRVTALAKWVKSMLLEKEGDKKQLGFPELEADIETSLTKSYIEFLKEIVQYYEKVGMLVQWTETYVGLVSALEGKDADAGIDSLEEVKGPKEEPAKVVEVGAKEAKTATA